MCCGKPHNTARCSWAKWVLPATPAMLCPVHAATTSLGLMMLLDICYSTAGVTNCRASFSFSQGWVACASVKARHIPCPSTSQQISGAVCPLKGPDGGPVSPSPPGTASQEGFGQVVGNFGPGSGKQGWSCCGQPVGCSAPGEGGQSPSPAFSLAQRRCYNNGEITVGLGLCVHPRTAAGSDYAATMFCSINIMSSLNLY